ncbi:MAG TPA: glycosyltransferase family 2 protein [Lacipirellulaceae bacterium]|nr:glycosyltransferase family 2 protein [Lacipirellulaceae bacterium]
MPADVSTLNRTDDALPAGGHGHTPADDSEESAASWSPMGSQRVIVALPAYNEGQALGPLLDNVRKAMDTARIPYEVLVVDDGSQDDTAQVAAQASFTMPVTLIEHGVNRGLAAALRTGFDAAVELARPGDVIVTMDADNSHPPALIPRMLSMVREGHDVVIASRFQSGARVVGVPWHRNLLSYGARALFQTAFPIRGVRDYTCGFRAYREDVLRRALEHFGDSFVSETGFSCMADVLLKLRTFPLIMGEAPLILRYDQKGGASKMRVARTVWQTLTLIARRRVRGA